MPHDHRVAEEVAIAIDQRASTQITTRLRRLVPLMVSWTVAMIVLGLVSIQQAAPAELLMLDAASAPSGRWYYGLMTSLGVLGWTIAMTSCGLTAHVGRVAGRIGVDLVFRAGSVLIAVLLIDDLFLVHSWMSAFVPVPEQTLPMIEMIMVVAWVLSGWRELRRTRWEFLLAAGIALGASTLLDAVPRPLYAGMWTVAEEGAKFLGIVALAVWAVTTAFDIIGSIAQRPAPRSGGR